MPALPLPHQHLSDHPRPQPACAAIMLLLCLTAGTSVHAQTQTLSTTSIQHTVRTGDTLEQLARRYLGEASLWQQLQSHNQVSSPYRLKPGTLLDIPLRWMRSSTASVDYVQGVASVRTAPDATATPVVQGMALREGDQLQLQPEAFVTVRLADGSTVRVQAQSQLQLSQLRRRGRAGSLQSVLELQQGGVEIQVPGKPDVTRRLDVVTPVAASSVRGTQFSVQLAQTGRTSTALYTGRLAIQTIADTTPGNAATLQAGHGIVVSAEGVTGPATPLLPAPSASALPTLAEDAQWLELALPAMEGVQAWNVSVSQDAAGQQVLRNGIFAPGKARFTALPDGLYQLQLRPLDAQGIEGHIGTGPLRVKAHPVAPLTQSPAPGALLAQGEGELLCTPVSGAQHYRLQVALLTDPASAPSATHFAEPALDSGPSAQCRFDLHALPAGSYAWRTASIRTLADGSQDQGPYAAPQVLRIAPRPAAPSAAAMQSRSTAGVEQIFWPGEPGQRFRLQAFATPDATTPALDTLLNESQWTAAGLPSGTWHIRIQVQDPSGLHSAFSPPRSVQILPLVRDGSGQAISTGTGQGLQHPPY